jgi:DUF971 family protein
VFSPGEESPDRSLAGAGFGLRVCYDVAMPFARDERGKPASVKIHVSSGAGVDIAWADGHRSHYEFEYLRDACPCATCDDERRRKAAQGSAAAAAGASQPGMGNPLPIFKPRPRAASARAVGNYAIQINFADGHNTGIYSFEYLRQICPCAECEAAFRR